jgi:hypothetical protein
VSGVIETRLSVEKRAEEAVKEEESDPKILVHQTLVVDHAVMNFVQITRRHEPPFEKPVPCHPEAFDVLNVMQVAEHQKAPTKRHSEKDELMQRDHVQQMKELKSTSDKHTRGNEPLQPDVAQRDAVVGGIEIRPRALFLQWPVNHEMVSHVISAQKCDPATV